MNKTIITILFVVISYVFIGIVVEENIEIPNDAIRIRILANSNDEYDQEIKKEVKEDIQSYMSIILKDTTNIEEARVKINNNLDNINKKVGNTLQSLDYKLPYKVNLGLNYFPDKEYKGVKYEAGYYESLLITLGKGEGDNWWCVLFPPLCLIEAEESTEVEYKSFIKEMLDKHV